MKRLLILTLILLIGLFFIGCPKPTDDGGDSGDGGDGNNPPDSPSNPSPEDGVTDIAINGTTLSWSCSDPDDDTLTYDIYFGEDSLPTEASATDLTSATYDPGTLTYSTTYHWQVVAKDGNAGETTGAEWTFTTEENPNNPPDAPSNPIPSDTQTDVATDGITLSWSCSDPDDDTLTYDIYFDADSLPTSPTATDLTTASYDPGSLTVSTTYHWQVIAKDGNGGETVSAEWTFTTADIQNEAPSVPENPNPSDDSVDLLPNAVTTLDWDDCTDGDLDPVTYDIYFGADTLPTSPMATDLTVSEWTISISLDWSTTYHWKVIAKDGNGGESHSPEWTFTINEQPVIIADPLSITFDLMGDGETFKSFDLSVQNIDNLPFSATASSTGFVISDIPHDDTGFDYNNYSEVYSGNLTSNPLTLYIGFEEPADIGANSNFDITTESILLPDVDDEVIDVTVTPVIGIFKNKEADDEVTDLNYSNFETIETFFVIGMAADYDWTLTSDDSSWLGFRVAESGMPLNDFIEGEEGTLEIEAVFDPDGPDSNPDSINMTLSYTEDGNTGTDIVVPVNYKNYPSAFGMSYTQGMIHHTEYVQNGDTTISIPTPSDLHIGGDWQISTIRFCEISGTVRAVVGGKYQYNISGDYMPCYWVDYNDDDVIDDTTERFDIDIATSPGSITDAEVISIAADSTGKIHAVIGDGGPEAYWTTDTTDGDFVVDANGWVTGMPGVTMTASIVTYVERIGADIFQSGVQFDMPGGIPDFDNALFMIWHNNTTVVEDNLVYDVNPYTATDFKWYGNLINDTKDNICLFGANKVINTWYAGYEWGYPDGGTVENWVNISNGETQDSDAPDKPTEYLQHMDGLDNYLLVDFASYDSSGELDSLSWEIIVDGSYLTMDDPDVEKPYEKLYYYKIDVVGVDDTVYITGTYDVPFDMTPNSDYRAIAIWKNGNYLYDYKDAANSIYYRLGWDAIDFYPID